MPELSDAVKRSLARDVIYNQLEDIEFMSTSELINETWGYNASQGDLIDIHNLVIHSEVDVTFEVD